MEEKEEDMKEDIEEDMGEEEEDMKEDIEEDMEEEWEDMEESECDEEEKKFCKRVFDELKEKEKVSTAEEEEESMNKHLPDASVAIYEPLLCRAVRIGSFKVNPATNTSFIYIYLAVNEMSFNAPMVTDKNKIVPITLKPCDITKMTYDFKRSLPIIFIFTTPSFAEALRKSLGMSSSSYAYFDPNSNDVTQNKITFLIDILNDDHRRFLQHVFLPDKKVLELGQKTTDEILIKPKAFPNTSNGSISRKRTAAALFNGAELATSFRPATKANFISASRITGGNDKSDDQYFGGTDMHSKPPKEKDSVKEKEEVVKNMAEVEFNADEKKEELYMSDVDEPEVPAEEDNEIHEPLLCRSIRIGSLKIFPEFKMSFINVYLAMDGISFKGLMVTDKNKVVTIITLKPCDITKMMVHFGKCLPIIFVFTTSSFAERLKKSLNVPSAYVYFDPNSSDETQEKITFLIDIVNDDQCRFLRHNFLPENRVIEIDQKTANEILLKSTPQAGQYLKLQMPLQDVQISTEPQLNFTPIQGQYLKLQMPLQEVQISTEPQLNFTAIQHISDKDAFRKICHSCKSMTNNPKFCDICKCNLRTSVQGEQQNSEVPKNHSGTSYEAIKKIMKMKQIIIQPHNDMDQNKTIQTLQKQIQLKTSSVIWAKRRAKLRRKQNRCRSSATEKSIKQLPVKSVTSEDSNMKSSEDDTDNGENIFSSLISVFSSNRAGLTITPILPATSILTSTSNTNSVSRVTGERLLKNNTLL